MSSAPTYSDWKALRLAVLALVAAGVTGQPKAFLKALREAKAAALTLLFALARSLLPEDEPEPKPRGPAPLGRLGVLWRDHDEDASRNPPAVAYRLDPRPIAPLKRGPSDPKRLDQLLAQAFQTLQRILSLCDDPDAPAARLRRRLDRLDAPLAAAEAKAFAVAARAEARRNHDARKLIDQTWRGRRRRDSGQPGAPTLKDPSRTLRTSPAGRWEDAAASPDRQMGLISPRTHAGGPNPMPKIDIAALPIQSGTRYPEPYAAPCKDRQWKALGAAGNLTQFGVNLVTLKPGVWSSQRHWHTHDDEFVYVLSGALILVDDSGRHPMGPGDAAAFKAGDQNGHHLINESDADATFLVVGGRSDEDHGAYSDIDMVFLPNRYAGSKGYAKKDGSSF